MDNEKVVPEWNYSEFPGVYYFFCRSCGNGISEGTQECPICKKEIDWENCFPGCRIR